MTLAAVMGTTRRRTAFDCHAKSDSVTTLMVIRGAERRGDKLWEVASESVYTHMRGHSCTFCVRFWSGE
jgi:hypothetical protein